MDLLSSLFAGNGSFERRLTRSLFHCWFLCGDELSAFAVLLWAGQSRWFLRCASHSASLYMRAVFARIRRQLVQFSTGSLYGRCETFKILDFYGTSPCHSNDFGFLDNFSYTFTVFVITLRYGLKALLKMNIYGWFYVVFKLLLCAILIFCFASMLRVVCKHARSARTLATQLRFNQEVFSKAPDKSAVKMMAVVVCLFLVCYGIGLRCSFVHLFSDHKRCNDLHFKVPLLVLNSAVNLLAYAIFKRDIKKDFKRMILKRCK